MPDILCKWRNHEESDSRKKRDYHFKEVEKLFSELIKQYPIEFFCNENEKITNKQKAIAYDWLGRQARFRGALKNAMDFYFTASVIYPNPLDKLFRHSFINYLSCCKQLFMK